MRELQEGDAIVVYNALIASRNEELIEKVNQALKCCAESSMGMYAMTMAWYGTELPQEVIEEICRHYTVQYFYDRNLLSFDGKHIELNVLASALPNALVMTHFHFDMEEKAREANVSLDEVRDLLRKYVVRFQKSDLHSMGEQEVIFSKNFDIHAQWHKLQVVGVGGIGERYDEYVCWGPLAFQNIKKLMEDDKVFCEKFNFLEGV